MAPYEPLKHLKIKPLQMVSLLRLFFFFCKKCLRQQEFYFYRSYFACTPQIELMMTCRRATIFHSNPSKLSLSSMAKIRADYKSIASPSSSLDLELVNSRRTSAVICDKNQDVNKLLFEIKRHRWITLLSPSKLPIFILDDLALTRGIEPSTRFTEIV